MATIPETPAVTPTLPGSKRKVSMPTVNESTSQAQSTFTTPFIAGESAIGTINTVSKQLNKVADESAIQDSKNQGYQDQQKAIEQGNPNYVGSGDAFSLSGKAYEAGASVAMVNKKSGEIDTQLGQLALKRQRDPDAFNKESNEIKNKVLGNLPAQIQSEVSVAFEKAKNNYISQINIKVLQDGFESNKQDILDGIDRDTTKVFTAIKTVGLQSSAITDGLANIQSNLLALKNYANLGPKELKTVSDATRQQIFGQWIKHEFDNRKNDPEGIKKFKEELDSGTYTFGALGEEFGNAIPGGAEISIAEGKKYRTILDKYESDYAKLSAGEKYTFNLQHKMDSDAIADGNKGFKVKWDVDANGNSVQTFTYDQQALNYNESTSRLLGNDEAKVMEHKIDLASSSFAGDIVARAKTDSEGKMNEAYTRIAQLKQLAKDAKTPYYNAVYSQAAEKAEKRVDGIIKGRLNAKTSGEGMSNFWQNKSIYGIDPNVNLTNSQGTDALVKAYESFSNSPIRYSELPSQQGNIELGAIKSGVAANSQQGLASIDQLITRQGKYAEGYITSALRASSDNNKSNDYALVEIINLRKQGKLAESEQLMMAYKASTENELALKTSIGTTDWNTEKADFQSKFVKKFGKDLDLKTSYAKSLLATTYQFYLKNRQAGIMNASESFETAASFISKNHVGLELSNGNTIMFPSSYLRDENGADMTNYVQDQLNDTINKPWLYNVIPADGQTVDRMIDNKDEYTMVFDNGRFILRNSAGEAVAQPMQKYPSDANSLYMSDVTVTVHPSRKPRTVFDDAEKTWDEFGNKKTFSSKLPKLYKENNPVTYDPFDETGEIFREGDDQKLMSYGEGLQKAFNENFVQRDAQGRVTYSYNDWMVPSIVGQSSKNRSIAQAISLKAVENNLTDRDLLWGYQNIPMMSKLGLNNAQRREYVLTEFKKNFNTISKLTTPTDGATRMSPWQVIMKIADEFVPIQVDAFNEGY